jgi:hypothetical protein
MHKKMAFRAMALPPSSGEGKVEGEDYTDNTYTSQAFTKPTWPSLASLKQLLPG